MWLVIDQVPKVLAMTGFWQLVESGEILLTVPRDYETDELGRICKFNPGESAFCFAPSATIITCHFKSGKRLLLLDFSNFDRRPVNGDIFPDERIADMELHLREYLRFPPRS